ncbi:MAG: Uma2 family endonuclease [Saprospiraceae bacterium]|nr:Uma2 family endonuclease [Saprospiraceae bacterium]MCF8248637.1 Uma2 family endonuclease [Saprospiraceae bacterium]MCF8278873.1 Uma2 family endonuclease [Bacteroidales bacterium]MCF8310673.1 Uma2 family endonuclease [Saprospiraceae bacterium]MCF8439232.1 Uma2 family endonuclease [Saprospiraceae bacterium]
MSTAAATAVPKTRPGKREPKRITKQHFLRYYSNREDGYKYEWNKGIVDKTEGINQRNSVFYLRLLEVFLKTSGFKEGGTLIMLTDMDTSPEQLRRPDIAYYTTEQLPKMWAGENQVAPWVCEVISPTDRAEDVNSKLVEYFNAGVQVVWHIFPHAQKVDVYTSPEHVTICMGKTVCSGAPALADFEMKAEGLFA